MRKYSREIVTQVLAANDIVDVVGASLELKPSGSSRFKALCPFHQEKTPSFHVSRDRQMYHCFGCGKGGDALDFVREFDGLSFSEALRKLADRGGIKLPAPTERESKEEHERDQLLKLNRFAASLFENTLKDPLKGGSARRYLKTRALKPETSERFRIGFAPDSWDILTQALRDTGTREAILLASGLLKRGDRGTTYAFFRNRLMVPIRDVSGNVVAFGGRDLSGDDAVAKYINTPENSVYKKGRVLYGLFEARDAMRREKRAILVEGYFDLMRCFDSGVENVVATCGTALTTAQAALLRRYVPEVVVVYDGDAAGIRAALRGVAVLNAAGLTVRALLLPDGQDPDDYVRGRGVDAFRADIDAAQDFVAFYVQMNADRLGTIEGRTDVAREIFTILLGVEDELRRDEYLKQVARSLKMDEWTVRREFTRLAREKGERRPAEPAPEPSETHALSADDMDFVATLLNSESLLASTRERLVGLELQPSPLAEVLRELLLDAGPDLGQRIEGEPARSLYAAAASREPVSPEKAEMLAERRVRSLIKEVLLAEAEQVREAMREAERSDDTGTLMELMTRRIGIEREIEELGAA